MKAFCPPPASWASQAAEMAAAAQNTARAESVQSRSPVRSGSLSSGGRHRRAGPEAAERSWPARCRSSRRGGGRAAGRRPPGLRPEEQPGGRVLYTCGCVLAINAKNSLADRETPPLSMLQDKTSSSWRRRSPPRDTTPQKRSAGGRAFSQPKYRPSPP